MNPPEVELLNGLACGALRQLIRDVAEKPSKGKVRLAVATTWAGGLRSDSRVKALELAGVRLPRPFTVRMDEPANFLGDNTGPNPQEMLLAAFNACLLAGYVAGCSLAGIALESLIIETEGELDLRGWFGLDASIRPGYDQLHYRVHIRGDGTPEQFQSIHEAVLATSPNRWNVANAIPLKAELILAS
jgi:uncharacterized OsmC-like protein